MKYQASLTVNRSKFLTVLSHLATTSAIYSVGYYRGADDLTAKSVLVVAGFWGVAYLASYLSDRTR